MALIDMFLIAFSLAMDGFAVSITAGLILKSVKLKTLLPIAVYMGFRSNACVWLVSRQELSQYIQKV